LGNSSATRTGSVLGTPYYMSPEQARGLRSVDYRSDLWSVGVIAYRCMIGVLPFEGEAVGDLLVKLCTAPLPIPSQVAPDVPPGFDAWFAKALTREPEGRFSSAAELAESLAAVCGLPVRGAYSTGDIPIPSFASGPMGHSSPAHTPAPGQTPYGVMPVTPYPAADRTGPNRAFAQSAGNANTLQMATGAPTTQTPAPTHGKNTGAIIAAAAAAVVVLAIGAAVLVKTLGGDSTAATPAPVETTALPASPPPAPPPVAPKLADPTPTVAVDPSPSAAPSVVAPAVTVAKPNFPPNHGNFKPPPGKPPKPGTAPAPGGADVGF
jgi:serine/threonine-protein kinase